MAEIESQATKAWGKGKAVAAYDFMRTIIPAPSSSRTSGEFIEGNPRSPKKPRFRS